MANKTGFRLKPFGAFHTVMLAQARKIFHCFGILELAQVSGGEHIGLDLVDVPGEELLE